ncbi:MAG TPA: ATP-binding protein [Gemmatimonadaceae bacterium]
MSGKKPSVDIRPGVSVLSVLRHLNYKPWYALAEFVDNSLQSFAANEERLKKLHGPDFRLKVDIRLDAEQAELTISDNAAGIAAADYERAFRPAEVPPDRTGLSEFGMGMKSAATWFAPRWSVITTPLGEGETRTVSFDISYIVKNDVQRLDVQVAPAAPDGHGTTIQLLGLYKVPQGSTLKKIRAHLASIYRTFLREGVLELRFNDDPLTYVTPTILVAPFYARMGGPVIKWFREIDLDLGLGLRAYGFAALREKGSTSEAGFALFRRKRLIQGSHDEGYRPERIFKKSNSYRYQRLFGELHLEGFEVSHTKDGFRWDENEDVFLSLLEGVLNDPELPLLDQADGWRVRPSKDDLQAAARLATERTAAVIEKSVVPMLGELVDEGAAPAPGPTLPPAQPLSERLIEVEFEDVKWRIVLETTGGSEADDWLEISDSSLPPEPGSSMPKHQVGVRLSLAHPFSVRFGGTTTTELEPLFRLGAAIALAETAARKGGAYGATTVVRNINELLADALSKP